MTKRAWSALMVAVAVIALLAVSFVPHHHHNGFMCLADEHYSCSDSHGTDVADVLGEADSCTTAAHHWHCDGNSGLCDGKEGHCGDGSGHNDDRSYCIEDEAFLNSRTENYQMPILPMTSQSTTRSTISETSRLVFTNQQMSMGHSPFALPHSSVPEASGIYSCVLMMSAQF